MQRSSKGGLLACGAVVALGLLVILSRQGSERSTPELPGEPSRAAPTPPEVVLAEVPAQLARTAAAATSRRTPGARAPRRRAPRRRHVREAPRATLEIQAVAEDTGMLIPGVMARVDAGGWARRRSTTDRSLECSVPSGVGLALQVEGEDLRFGRVSLSVPPLAPGERREVVARLPVGGLRYCGRVLDCERRVPVAGATVAVSTREPESGTYFTTDASGLFELEVAPRGASEPLELRIEARGLGLALGRVEPGHESPASARVFRLRPSATLLGRVRDGFGRPLAARGVVVRAPSGALRQPRPPETSFEHQDVDPWTAETDEAGAYVVDGLPARTVLRVELPRDGGLPPEVRELVLGPGETRHLDVVLESPVSLSLLVLDPEGAPASRLELRIERAPSPAAGYLAGGREGFVLRTDDAGWCRTKALPGLWRIGPLRRADLAPWGEPIEVRAAPASQSAILYLQRGQYLRGRVEEAGGAPAKRVAVTLRSEGSGLTREQNVRLDGTFEIGPLVAGEYLLQARTRNGQFGGEEVRTRAGAEGVVLRLSRSAGSIHGEVLARGSPAEDARVCLLPREDRLARAIGTSSGSRFAFRRLPGGLYDLIATDGRGGWGQALDLTPGPARGAPATIELQPATTVRVAYVGDAPRAEVRALRGERIVARGEVASGLDVILWVPPGALTIELLPQDGSARSGTGASRRVVAVLDEEVELTFP